MIAKDLALLFKTENDYQINEINWYIVLLM